VWGWAGELEDGANATVYQLLSSLLRSDAGTLAGLRVSLRDPGMSDWENAC